MNQTWTLRFSGTWLTTPLATIYMTPRIISDDRKIEDLFLYLSPPPLLPSSFTRYLIRKKNSHCFKVSHDLSILLINQPPTVLCLLLVSIKEFTIFLR